MKNEYHVRSNVKVVFDSYNSPHPKARLMYKVRWLCFSWWKEVNYSYTTDTYNRARNIEEVVRGLIKQGNPGKHKKIQERKLNNQIKNLKI